MALEFGGCQIAWMYSLIREQCVCDTHLVPTGNSTNLSTLLLVYLLSPWGPTTPGTLSLKDALKSTSTMVRTFVLVIYSPIPICIKVLFYFFSGLVGSCIPCSYPLCFPCAQQCGGRCSSIPPSWVNWPCPWLLSHMLCVTVAVLFAHIVASSSFIVPQSVVVVNTLKGKGLTVLCPVDLFLRQART